VPVTTAEVTVATAALLVLHTPPVDGSPSVIDEPTHVAIDPVIGAGNAFTVNIFDEIHPPMFTYLIVAVPAATAVTIPDVFIVATAVLVLLHVPPASEELSADVEPAHAEIVPLITAGAAFTVTTDVVLQPVAKA
jgi:hypothetical protein